MSNKRFPFLATFIPGIALMLSPAMVSPVLAQGSFCEFFGDPSAGCENGEDTYGCQWCIDSYGDQYNLDCDDDSGWYEGYPYALCAQD